MLPLRLGRLGIRYRRQEKHPTNTDYIDYMNTQVHILKLIKHQRLLSMALKINPVRNHKLHLRLILMARLESRHLGVGFEDLAGLDLVEIVLGFVCLFETAEFYVALG